MYVVCQHNWILTPPSSQAQAESDMLRLSEWFSFLETVVYVPEEAEEGSRIRP